MMEWLKSGSLLTFYPVLVVYIVLRYVVMAGVAYYFVWVRGAERFKARRTQKRMPKRGDIRREIVLSVSSLTILAAVGTFSFWMRHRGYTLGYDEISDYGWGYWFLSLAVVLLIHDAYFYFAHRLMHHPLLFNRVHRWHHLSTSPTPWAAFAFHPLEALIEAGIVPLVQVILPTHFSLVAAFTVLSLVFNVLGHLGYELFPKGFSSKVWTGWFSTTTHHDLHHESFRYNYGFYTTWWDRLFRTAHPAYHDRFDRNARKTSERSGEDRARPALSPRVGAEADGRTVSPA